MATKSDNANEKAAEDKPASNKGKKIIVFVSLLLLPAGAASGTYFMLLKKSPPKHVRPTIGPTLALDSFIVNLADEAGNRYLKLTIDLELGNASEEEVKRLMPRFRDQVILHLSGLKMQHVLKNETKIEIKKKMMDIGKEAFGKGGIKSVYIKEFVMQ